VAGERFDKDYGRDVRVLRDSLLPNKRIHETTRKEKFFSSPFRVISWIVLMHGIESTKSGQNAAAGFE